jgi:hypothetical protein
MPGFIHMFPTHVRGEIMSLWMCQKCNTVFGFSNGEKLYCTKCKSDGYPVNLDPSEEVKSRFAEIPEARNVG